MNVGVYFSNNPSDVGGGYTFERELLFSLHSVAQESNHNFVIFSRESIKKYILQNNSKNVRYVIVPSPNIFARSILFFMNNFFPMSPFFRRLYSKFSNIEKCGEKNMIEVMVFSNPFHEPTDIPYVTVVWDFSIGFNHGSRK